MRPNWTLCASSIGLRSRVREQHRHGQIPHEEVGDTACNGPRDIAPAVGVHDHQIDAPLGDLRDQRFRSDAFEVMDPDRAVKSVCQIAAERIEILPLAAIPSASKSAPAGRSYSLYDKGT